MNSILKIGLKHVPYVYVLHVWKLTFCDLTLTWPWLITIELPPRYRAVTIFMPLSTKDNIYNDMIGLSRRHCQKEQYFSFDLGLTWPVTSIFFKYLCFKEFRPRCIQRRLPLVATLRRSRDLRGGANCPPIRPRCSADPIRARVNKRLGRTFSVVWLSQGHGNTLKNAGFRGVLAGRWDKPSRDLNASGDAPVANPEVAGLLVTWHTVLRCASIIVRYRSV